MIGTWSSPWLMTEKVSPFLTLESRLLFKENLIVLFFAKALLGTRCSTPAVFIPNHSSYPSHMGSIYACVALAPPTPSFVRRPANFKIDFYKPGNSRSCLRKAYNKTIGKSRFSLLFEKKPQCNPNSEFIRIIMRFSRQHVQIRNILQRNWTILMDDPKLKPFIPPYPAITYKRTSSIKDKLVQSEFKDAHKRFRHCSTPGSFPCDHCSHCPLIRKEKIFCLPNGETFKPSHFVNCQTRGVVYFMEC